jgi:hypothetical protein
MTMRRRPNKVSPAAWEMYHFPSRIVLFGDK